MSSWHTLRANKLLPAEIRALAETAANVSDMLDSHLETIKQGLELAQQFSSMAAANPVEASIRGILDEIDQLVSAVTSDRVVHTLMVPVQKQYFGRGIRLPEEETEKFPDFLELTNDGTLTVSAEVPTGETIRFINAAPSAVGGSQGFWKTITASLADEGDFNRPLFPADYAVAGACLLFGGNDLSSIQGNINLFSSLINGGERASLAAGTRPYIRNFTARTTVLTVSTGGLAVQLDWDPIQPLITYPLYSDDVVEVKEILIVRSMDPKLREWFHWDQVFEVQPKDDPTDLPESGVTKVIARISNDGLIKRYIDTDDSVKLGDTHYYTAILRYSLNGKIQPMGSFCNCVRTTILSSQSRKGEPPDWFAVPSLTEVFPDLATLISHVRVLVSSLGSRTTSNNGISSLLSQTIRQIENLVLQIESAVDELTAITNRLVNVLQSDIAATSATVFSVGSGGINGWLYELARRLSDPTDPSRPPFEKGSELVAGVVIVAGAPNTAQLEAYLRLLEMLFGASEENPLLRAIDDLEQDALPQEAPTGFDAGMSPTPADPPEALPTAFDDSLQSTTRVVC